MCAEVRAATNSASKATNAAPSPQLPRPPVRMIAEWEPAKGAMIRWPLKVPDACVVELADASAYTIFPELKETMQHVQDQVKDRLLAMMSTAGSMSPAGTSLKSDANEKGDPRMQEVVETR